MTGSITSINSYPNLNGGGRKESNSHKKARKLIPHPRKSSKGDVNGETHRIYGDNTDTTRLGSQRDINLSLGSLNSSLNQRRPSHPPYASSSRQQLYSHLKSQDSQNLQSQSSQDAPSETSSRFRIRIHRANNTYHVVSCGFNITVAQLTPKLNAKLLLGEERETHRLYLKERGRERILTQTERPADIVRRRLEQAGYDVSDGFELLGGEGLSFLLKFVYKSQVFGPAVCPFEQSLVIEDYERVDLSGRSLRTIPVALHQHADQITSLYLSRNPMLDLPLDFIQATSRSLTELRLSHMALKKVPPNIRCAISLTRLDLSSNRIGDLDDAYLEGIPGLKSLKVQNNRIEKLPWHFPRLRGLTTLNISNNKFRSLPVMVCQLESLRDLDISFNTISELPEELGLLRNLEHLIMVGNQITSIPPTASSLVSLRRLDCSRNLIGDLTVIGMLPKLEKLSTDYNRLNGVDLSLGPNLSAIDAGHNEITEIRVVPGPVGNPGPYTALFSLDVSYAKLSSISALALSSLPSLHTLRLTHNNIKVLPSSLGDLDYLEVLECADNLLERLPQGIGRLKRLEVLDVHENNLTELPGELWTCVSLKKLNATSNLIEKWGAPPPPTSQTGELVRTPTDDLHMHPFPDRKGSNSSVNDPFSPTRLPGLAYALEKLYLGENQFTAESLGFLSLFQKLKVLNLSFNLIQELPPGFFKNFLSDIFFAASQSPQQPQPSHKSSLEELYLSGNKLTTLPTEDLARMTRLSTLFLNGNRLQTLPQELGKVQSLTVLDVGSNVLKYNIYNWEFDWNWNFNKNLKYLNLSGNKRLQIRSNNPKLGPNGSRHSKIPDTSTKSRILDTAITSKNQPSADMQQQSLGGFTNLSQLRVLGLMDVTITTTGQSVIPDEHEDRRVRTSESTVGGMAYGIADTLGRNDHLNMLDLVHEFSSSSTHRKNEAIFAIFGRSQPPKAMPPGISGNKIAKFLRDNFVEVFNHQLAGLKKERAEGVPDALRRSFLKINQNLHDVLFSNRIKNSQAMQASSSGGSIAGPSADVHDAFVQRGGASGVVLYFRGKTMYVANAGNALAVVSRGGYPQAVSRKHDPYDRLEMSRIRAAEGWISPAGLVNDEIDISRSFGFFHLLPVVNARPDIFVWELSEHDEFVIVANRGLWDFVTYKTAVDIARRERGDPMLAAQKLRDFAISYGADGSTMIMVISISDLFRTDEARSREGSIVDPQPFRVPKTIITDRGLSRLQDEVPAPTGHLALVFTDIRNSTHLWDVNRGMNTAWRLHNTLLRRKLRFCGGYEVKTEGDAFMCAFPTTMAAVWWSLAVQMELLDQEWPLEILECEDGKPIYDHDNQLIAQGLSVRMGIHCGAPLCEVDPVNHRMDYFGPMVNRSARINSSAAGGQIMCSEEVIREIKAKLHNGPQTPQSDVQPPEAVDNVRRLGLSIIEVGAVKLKGLELPEQLSLIYPAPLIARHNLREVVADSDASGSRVQFSVSQIRQLGLVCLRLESLATSRIFKEMSDRKSSIQSVSQGTENDNEEEEDPLYIYGDPNLLLPPLDEKTSSDRDMTLVLDALSGRIENAVAKIRERALIGSVKDALTSVIDIKRGCLDERTLESLLNIIQGI
ncbi:adenylate cyclase [Lentinula aciculospora]|uniref:Adenylate cyclase n=1 Tax=Lentinula aciculospora TaxID=153920 RepID=A0A9W8ZXD7_9AGAR|nr:adenylate cyclase [Lentinula aciculospora]